MSNSQFDDLMKKLPIADLAAALGVDASVAEEAASKALPGLLGGMAYNTSHGGEADLEAALAQHQGDVEMIEVDAVDPVDGEKIVGKVFGEDKDQTIAALAGSTSSSQAASLVPKILPMLAPLVMGYLASNVLGKATSSQKTSGKRPQASSKSAGGVGDLLGGLLGGSGAGDLLGGLFGGSSKGGSGGGLGGLLGGLFGGR
mgnify:CR=1 FL=1